MSNKALSLKSQNESILKDVISEYHTVDENDSSPINNIDVNEYLGPDKHEAEVPTEETRKFLLNMSKNSSDAKISALKAEVQNIFETFDQNLEDFELFKYKFTQTIDKYKKDSVTKVESFMKDLIEHNICESDCNLKNASSLGLVEKKQPKEVETKFCSLNYKYFPNFTPDEVSFNLNSNSEITFNTFVLSDDQLLETELNSPNFMSENILRKTPALVLNKRILSQKTIERSKCDDDQDEEIDSIEDKYIPIKTTRAKEDLKNKQEENDIYKDHKDTFFIFKICSFICKKIRGNPIA